MEGQKNNNKMLIIVGIIVAVLVVTIGVAYALYTFSESGLQSKLVTGEIYMKYAEDSALNLLGAMPSSNYPTKASGNYYQFVITGKNTHTTHDVSYNVKVVKGDVPDGKSESNRIADTWLYFKLVEVGNPGTGSETETAVATDVHFSTISNSLVYTGSIPKNTTNTLTKTYRLYARIDNNLVIGNTSGANYSQSTWNGLFASIKVNVDGA